MMQAAPAAFQFTMTLGTLFIVASVVGATVAILKGLKYLLSPLFVRFDEHDILWEEYSLGHGRSYRRSRGRGIFTPAKDEEESE